MYAQLRQPPPALTSRRPDLPPAADQVFARALAKAPGDRYPTCREFADALRAAFGLAPYDSGPEVIPAAVHPPSGPARPTSADDAPGPAAPAPRTPVPPAAFGRPAPAPGRRSRRGLLAALAAVLVLAAAAIVAHTLYSGLFSRPLATIPITATSGLAPVTGDVYVEYHLGRHASAQVHGEVSGLRRGETAELFAQPFPYRHAPVRSGSAVLAAAGRGAAYAFTVIPALATRYYVELFPSAGATAPVARSRTVTIYVTRDLAGGALACRSPFCRATIPLHVFVPASAMSTEISKHWYPYGAPGPATAAADLQLMTPANPHIRSLLKALRPQISKPRRISATEFGLTISFPPSVAKVALFWHFTACAADTETRDGLGLPGRHACGLALVPPGSYLG